MISSYELTLQSADGAVIPNDRAYALYSWLLSALSAEEGDALHLQGDHPVSQYLYTDRGSDRTVWRISILNDLAHALFSEKLNTVERIELHSGILSVADRTHSPILSPAELIRSAKNSPSTRTECILRTPTAFRQNGKYAIFPQEKLIVQGLIRSWTAFCPDLPLDDPDAMQMLTDGLCITAYSLHTERYHLKNAVVPGFVGRMTVSPRLSAPMLELWNTLIRWGEYSGLGIKTTLGMGGLSLREIKAKE